MEDNKALVQIRSQKPKIGSYIYLESFKVQCIDRKDSFFIIQFDRAP